ncbi:hypothetical protein KHA80_00635 [Anaerobacillus sp. HL2]|nr:hypothetical protein KHA80_00635 [Anaerobacillus sp. HL2]
MKQNKVSLKVKVTGKIGKPLVSQWFDGQSVTVQSTADRIACCPLTTDFKRRVQSLVGRFIKRSPTHVSDVIVPVEGTKSNAS